MGLMLTCCEHFCLKKHDAKLPIFWPKQKRRFSLNLTIVAGNQISNAFVFGCLLGIFKSKTKNNLSI